MILQAELTNRCNYTCAMCPQSYWRKESRGGNPFSRERGDIAMDTWDLVLHNAQQYADCLTLGFFGEQMMHPRFCELMARIPKESERRYRVVMFTNFSRVTAHESESLSNVDNLRISIDASCSEVYERVRPGGDVFDLACRKHANRYEGLVAKVEWWLHLRNRPATSLMFVRSSLNRSDENDFVRKFRPLLGPTDDIITKSVVSYGGVIKDGQVGTNACKVPNERRLTVAWNGDLTPCNLDVDVAIKVGNIRKAQDVGTVIASRAYKDALASMRRKDGICANCPDANNHTQTHRYRRAR